MASPRPQPGIRPLFALFLSLFFLVFLLPWATGSSPLESSHLYRVLHIQERERLPPAIQVAAARGLLARPIPRFQLRIRDRFQGRQVLDNVSY